MPTLPPSVQTTIEQIEANMRDAAKVADPVVRKILSAILERQASYFRHLMALGRTPYGPEPEAPGAERRAP